MKIMLWCDSTWPVIGGVEVLASRFVRALKARGHELLIVTSTVGDGLPEEDSFEGTPMLRLPFRAVLEEPNLSEMVRLRSRITAAKRDFATDVVHVFHSGPSSFFHLQTAAAYRSATVTTLHQTYSAAALGPETIRGRLLRSSSWIVACSSAVLEETMRRLPGIGPCLSVIPNSLDMPAIEPTPPPIHPSLLCLGRLVPQKGFDLALRALARLTRRRPDLTMAIVGDGPERQRLETLTRELGLEGSVTFTGWVEPAMIPSVISNCSAVLMPSRSEPFGLVALQAGQMARPVIATRVDGLREVVGAGRTGLLVEPDNVEALASGVEYLLDRPEEAESMGKLGRVRAETVFAWDAHVRSYEELYRRLVGARE